MIKNAIGLALFTIPLMVWAQQKTFVINGKLGILNKPAAVSLSYEYNGARVTDTAYLDNGSFVLKGRLTEPVMATLTVFPKGPFASGMAGNYGRMLWIEPSVMKLEDSVSLSRAKIQGSSLQRDEDDFHAIVSKFSDDSVGLLNATSSFIKSHPQSMISLIALNQIDVSRVTGGIPDVRIVEPLYKGLSESVKQTKLGREFKVRLEAWKQSRIGKRVQDFVQPDQRGKPVRLSSFRGKYVLIDFWASWCHPCRDESPNLLKAYRRYKDKGLVVLAISLDGGKMASNADAARKLWLEAIEEDSVNEFVHVCDFKGHENNPVRLAFGVGSIPENFLIDPSGKVIAKSLRGEGLVRKLEEVFSNDTMVNSVAPMNFNEPLQLDTTVRTGVLPNGFRYFIRRNTYPENRVLLYLANKVGSIVETENEQGLAHFLEHMNFNGTTHFPKNELINYLQQQGVRFGADINAYTGFDETVYQLPIPSNKPEVVTNGMQIMRDWAKGATLDSTEIERERGVVLEEKRMTLGAGERIRRQLLPVLFNQSLYVQRLPIGVDSVLINFKPEVLRNFYDKWYRPDLQALLVVGDVNVDQIEAMVREKFKDLKMPANAPNRSSYEIPLREVPQFLTATDPEQTATTIDIIWKHRADSLRTVGQYRNLLIQSMVNIMLSNRLSILTSGKSDPPLQSASGSIGEFQGGLINFGISLRPNPGQIEKGVKAVYKEISRLKKDGFIIPEIQQAKEQLLSRLENKAEKAENTPSSALMNELLQYYLKGTAQPGIASELTLTKRLLPGISKSDVDLLFNKYASGPNRDVIMVAPDSEKSTLPDRQQILSWMSAAEKEKITPFVFSATKPLMPNLPHRGRIISEDSLTDIDAVKWTLANGAQVIAKKTKFELHDVTFHVFAPGGNSVLADSMYPSAKYATMLSAISGIGNLSYTELNNMVSTKPLAYASYIGDYSSGMEGFFNTTHTETVMQLIHLGFTSPSFDKQAIDGMLRTMSAGKKNKIWSPEEQFYKVVLSSLWKGNIRGQFEDSAFIAQVSAAKAEQVYREFFGSASGFTFIFTGDFSTDSLKRFVEQYLASLPGSEVKKTSKKLDVYPAGGTPIETVYAGLEDKAKVNMTFVGDVIISPKTTITLEALTEVLKIQLLTRLREQEGGVYSPAVDIYFERAPVQRYRMRIGFDCAPANVEKLIAATWDEIKHLQQNGPSMTDLDKFKQEDLNDLELKMKNNGYWANYIQNQITAKRDLNEIKMFENVLQSITTADVQYAADQYLKPANLLQFILMPEKK